MRKPSNTTCSSRAGSTLTEVLIAMLVLGIGSVSVMTLFPVATMRAIKSNQMTQSTVARYHAETAVGAYELGFYELFYGPNRRPGDGTVVPPFPYWEPGPNGQFGTPPPDYDDFPRFDYNLFNPRRYTLQQYNNLPTTAGTQDDFDSILIDPLGFYRMGGDVAPNSNAARLFGTFEPEVLNNTDGERPFVLPRVTGGHRGNNTNSGIGNRLTEAEARALVTLPDQYSTLLDSHVAANGFYSVDLNNRVDADVMTAMLGGIASFVDSGNQVTVALVDLDGNVHMRTVTGSTATAPEVASTGRTVGFTPALPEDPPGSGNPISIERAIVQQQNSDFTWMISARVSLPVEVSMDVVVFFKRAYAEADERIFYTRVLDSSTATGVGGGGIGSIYNKVRIDFTGDPPFAKKGGYLFDTQNNRWYRILEITLETSTRREMILEYEVRDDDGNVNADGTFGITSAFPRGVIDVFPIGKKTSVYNANP